MMPVSSSSADGESSSNVGAERWIEQPLLGCDRAALVDRAAEHVHDAAERLRAHGHADRRAGIDDLHAAAQAVRGAERNRAHDTVAELLLHFERETDLVQLQRIVDLRHPVARELHVDDRADTLNYRSLILDCLVHIVSLGVNGVRYEWHLLKRKRLM